MSKMPSVQFANIGIRVVSFLGFCLSYYSYIVEINMEHDSNYVAMCDISEHMSCTKAFNSKYGRGFGVIGAIFGEQSILNQPNSVPGMIFYITCFSLSLKDCLTTSKMLYIASIVSNFMSLYLAYILYFILHDFCIVCVSTYAVNFLMFVFSWSKYNNLKQVKETGRDKKE